MQIIKRKAGQLIFALLLAFSLILAQFITQAPARVQAQNFDADFNRDLVDELDKKKKEKEDSIVAGYGTGGVPYLDALYQGGEDGASVLNHYRIDNLGNQLLRDIQSTLLRFFRSLVASMEMIARSLGTLSLSTFASGLDPYIQPFVRIAGLLAVISIIIIGMTYVFSGERGKEKTYAFAMSVAMFASMNFLFDSLESMRQGALNGPDSLYDSLSDNERLDYTVMREFTYNVAESIQQGRLVSLKESGEQYTEALFNKTLDPESYKWDKSVNSAGAYPELPRGFRILRHVIKIAHINDLFVYAYSCDFLMAIITMGILAFVLFLISIKTVKLMFEIAIQKLIFAPVVLSDNGQGHGKQIFRSVINAYCVLVLMFICFKVFITMVSSMSDWVNSLESVRNIPLGAAVLKIVAIMGLGWGVIDGPDIIVQIFRYDAGVHSAWGALGGFGLARMGTRGVKHALRGGKALAKGGAKLLGRLASDGAPLSRPDSTRNARPTHAAKAATNSSAARASGASKSGESKPRMDSGSRSESSTRSYSRPTSTATSPIRRGNRTSMPSPSTSASVPPKTSTGSRPTSASSSSRSSGSGSGSTSARPSKTSTAAPSNANSRSGSTARPSRTNMSSSAKGSSSARTSGREPLQNYGYDGRLPRSEKTGSHFNSSSSTSRVIREAGGSNIRPNGGQRFDNQSKAQDDAQMPKNKMGKTEDSDNNE
ncbi:MAG: hypothetical protein Q4P72_06125 [Eubacteriales bacterium]|nr:hypothetical protein [Eubacteriales bacterium]